MMRSCMAWESKDLSMLKELILVRILYIFVNLSTFQVIGNLF